MPYVTSDLKIAIIFFTFRAKHSKMIDYILGKSLQNMSYILSTTPPKTHNITHVLWVFTEYGGNLEICV